MTVYCPLCGNANSYSLEKPKVCAKCGKAFASAFKNLTSDDEERVIIPNRKVKRPHLLEINSEEFSENNDEDTKAYIKEQVMASLKIGSIKINKPISNSVKMEDLFKNPDIIDNFQNPMNTPDGA